MPVARLRLLDAKQWLWSHPGLVGASETSEKTEHVNHPFCDREFIEMEPNEQVIGVGATSRRLFLKDTCFNSPVSNFEPNRSRARDFREKLV